MATRWFYTHSGHELGPFTAEQMRTLAALGLLQPDDRVWPEGADAAAGAPARGAIDFAALPPPRLPSPDWLADVAGSGAVGPQPTDWPELGMPDWVEEQLRSGPLADAAVPVPAFSERVRRAQTAIHTWADMDVNRALILAGDRDAIRRDVAIRLIVDSVADCGPAVVDRLWEHLDFVVANRRRYYRAAGGRGR